MDKKIIKITVISTLLMFIALFDYSIVTVVLPYLSKALNTGILLTNWISISLILFCVASGLSLGVIVPKVGMLKIGKISIITAIICGLTSALILNPWVIIIARSIQGVCVAIMAMISYLLISKFIDKEHLGFALGILTGGSFLSVALAPTIGGLIAHYLQPQLIFLVTIPISIISLILIFTLDTEWKEDLKLDYKGIGLWTIGMVLFILGTSIITEPMGIICFAISIIILSLFIIYELKSEHPLYDFRLLKNKVYAANNYSAMTGCFVKDGLIFVLLSYLQFTEGLNSIESGLIISILIIIMLFVSPLAGKLSTTINSVKLANIGSLLMVISTVLFCLKTLIPQVNIFIPIAFLGVGYGLFDTPNKKIILESGKESELGHVTAFLSTIRDFGMMLPTVIFTLVLILLHNSNMFEITAAASQIMFILFFIVALSSLIMNLHFNKNLEIIYKIKFKNIINPLTTRVEEAVDIIYKTPKIIINTTTQTTNKINKMTNTGKEDIKK